MGVRGHDVDVAGGQFDARNGLNDRHVGRFGEKFKGATGFILAVLEKDEG
jgi:hypothetical protein